MDTHKWNLGTFAALLALILWVPGLLAQGEKGQPGDKDQRKEESPPSAEMKAAAHGGVLLASKEKEFQAELVMQAEGIRLYLYDAKSNPVSLKQVTGETKIDFKDLSKQPIDAKMVFNEAIPVKPPDEKTPGGVKKTPGDEKGEAAQAPKEGEKKAAQQGPPQESLWAAIDLKGLKEGEATVKIHLAALQGSKEKEIELTAPFKLTAFEKPKEAPAPKPEGKRPD